MNDNELKWEFYQACLDSYRNPENEYYALIVEREIDHLCLLGVTGLDEIMIRAGKQAKEEMENEK